MAVKNKSVKTQKIPDVHSKQVENAAKVNVEIKDDGIEAVPMHELESISNNMVNINSIAGDIIELYPEVELVMEIMTSLIIAPNDAETETLLLDLNNTELPSHVVASISDLFEAHINNEYKIIDKLDDIIKESLYTHGSYVELNIPTMFINDILKLDKTTLRAGLESYIKTNERHEYSKEVVDSDLKITITDSLVDITLSTLVNDDIKAGNENKFYSDTFGMENITAGTESLVYRDGLAFATGYENNDGNIDKPIVKKVNPASIIPIADANNPKVHYGYFYLVGKDGRDIKTDFKNQTEEQDEDYIKGIFTNINRVKNNIGKDNTPEISNIADMKKFILRNKLDEYLETLNMDYKTDVNIELDDTLALTLAEYVIDKRALKVIYLPKELVSYYAINFRSNGTGSGLLERVTTLASIRGIMTFSNLLAFVKSSISTSEVTIEADPDDPNYRLTVKKVLAEVVKNNQYKLPVRMLKANSFIQWTHKLGYKVKTIHPEFPDMNITVEEKANEVNPVDTELFEKIDKQILTALYFSPEMLEESHNVDFATQARQQFFILNKRVKKIQKNYNKLITDDVRKKFLLDGSLITKLKTILEANISDIKKKMVKANSTLNIDKAKKVSDEHLVKRIMFTLLSNVNVSLQKPNKVSEEVSLDKFNNFTDMLDGVLEKLLSEDAIPEELIGDLSGKLQNASAAIKIGLIRDYMANNKILPELNKMFTLDENGKPDSSLLESFGSYSAVLNEIIVPFIKDTTEVIEDNNKDVAKATTVKEESTDSGGEDSTNKETNSDDTNSDNEDDTSNEDNGDSETKDEFDL